MDKKEFAPEQLVDSDKTIAKELFEGVEVIWDVLPNISEFIVKLGNGLPEDVFEKRGENVWVAKSAKVAPTAYINGPCIIDEEAEIRHCAFIRGNAIVGKGATVGNSTELKNVVLFDKVEVPHYNYVGDSVLGFKAHLGAGAITSNVKNDKTNVTVKADTDKIQTGLRKFGAIVGDYTQVGCNSVLNPGTVLGKNVSVYPLSFIRGYIAEGKICKSNVSNMEIMDKE